MASKKQIYIIKTKYGTFESVVWFGKRERVYFVSVPAFPRVLTEARSLAEAKKYASEVIELQCLAAFDEKKIVVDDRMNAHGKAVRSGAFSLVA